MKIEVNDYVRTKWGYICKIININEFREPSMKYGVEASYLKDIMFIGDEEIIKSSSNIIDLIEVGDYLNGFRVCDSTCGLVIIAPTEDIREMNSIKDEFRNNDLFVSKVYKLEDIEIKSIVTKEQFSSMEYKIGDE